MRILVRPFVEAAERNEQPEGAYGPDLRIYDYDDDGSMMIPVPGTPAAAVANILLTDGLIETTRVNVRLRFDDVNDGSTTVPATDYYDMAVLRGWTLRALEEWVEWVTPRLVHRIDPEGAFRRVYADFEAHFFDDRYMWISFAPFANFIFHGPRVDLEPGVVIRYLDDEERNLRHSGYDDYRGRHRGPAPRVALVTTISVVKGEKVNLGDTLPARNAAELALFCIRSLRPGGAYCDEQFSARDTCWGLDSCESQFSWLRHVPHQRGNSFLDEHASRNLSDLWGLVRRRATDFNSRFLATKLQDNAERTSLLDRFVDAAIILQNIYGSGEARFVTRMTRALASHRDTGERTRVAALAERINLTRNGILHGDSEVIEPLIADLDAFRQLTEETEECMRRSLQLLYLNEHFRKDLKRSEGDNLRLSRLPYTF